MSQSLIIVWSSDSLPSKDYESSLNRPFTHFDEVVANFQRVAFNQNLKDSLPNSDYKVQPQKIVMNKRISC